MAREGGVEPRQVCAYVRCDNEPIMLQIGIWRPVLADWHTLGPVSGSVDRLVTC